MKRVPFRIVRRMHLKHRQLDKTSINYMDQFNILGKIKFFFSTLLIFVDDDKSLKIVRSDIFDNRHLTATYEGQEIVCFEKELTLTL